MEGGSPPPDLERVTPTPEDAGILEESLAMALPLGGSFARTIKTVLETEVVLEHIFGYLSVSDLCSTRQVCTLWNQEAVPLLKKRSRPIKLLDEPENEEYVAEFLEIAVSSRNFPFTNLDMQDAYFEDYSATTWKAWMEGVAPWVTSLSLYNNQPTIYPFPTFPQLTALKFESPGPGPQDCAFFLQVLQNAPNLTTLKLIDSGGDSLLRQLNQMKDVLHLTHFCLKTYVPQGDPDQQNYCRSLLDLLESQRQSLQTLHFRCSSGNLNLSPSFSFPSLEHLCFSWEVGGYLSGDAFSRYAQTFPKVRSLRLQNKKFWREFAPPTLENWETVLQPQKAALSVTHLKIVGLSDPGSQQRFRENAPKLFPHVSHLETENNNGGWLWTVTGLAGAFGQLEKLSLDLGGIPRETWERLRQVPGEQLREAAQQLTRKMEEEQGLRRLRMLKIKYRRDQAQVVSPCVGERLRIHMPHLQTLHLVQEGEARPRVPRELPPWMRELERNTTIIFN